MSEPQFQVQVIGLDEAKRHMERSHDAMALAPRSVLHHAATLMRDALRHAAPEGKTEPHSRDQIDFIITEDVARGYGARFLFPKVQMFVIKGTAAHDIWAGFYTGKSSSKVLHFTTASGEEVFTPYVRHPGTKPNDFRRKAWLEVREAVMEILRETGRAVIRGEEIREFGVGI